MDKRGGALHASTGSTFISLPESSSSSSSLSSGNRRCRKRATTKPVWKSKFYVAFVLNHRVVLHAIDAPDTLVDFHTVRSRWSTASSGG